MTFRLSFARQDELRHQTRVVLVLAVRNHHKHLLSLTMVAFAAFYFSLHGWVWWVIAFLFAAEVLKVRWARNVESRGVQIGPVRMLTLFALSVISTGAYMAFGIAFVAQGSLVQLVFGMIWSFGVFLYVATTYMQFPIYSILHLVPSSVLAMAQIWVVRGTEYDGFSTHGWWLVGVAFLVYCSTTMEVAASAQETTRTLRHAQRTASSRLRELETLNALDSLTGLLNRRAFEARLDERLADSDSPPVTLFLVDLDGFKPVNDSYSHEAGDALLTTIARRLKDLSPDVICGRMGGDEFVLAVEGLTGEAHLKDFGRRIVQACSRPVLWDSKQLEVGASVGVVQAIDGLSATDLCNRADRAMYTAKSDPERDVAIYHPGQVVERTSLQDRSKILRALHRGEFQPFYQPKVDLASGETVGFEALARRVLPDGKVLGPGTFLPILAEFGLMNEFTLSLTRRVLSDLKTWTGQGLFPGQVSINIPESTLATLSGRRDLIALLSSAGGLQNSIVVEITEDVFIARAGGTVRETVRQIRDIGVSVSLDDFGTGYASFQHLRDLQFDELKIDTSFVRDLGHDFSAEVLIEGVLEIARGLGVRVIAEGVETEEQRSRLLEMGCRSAQGFFWSQAVPADQVPGWLCGQAADVRKRSG